MKILPDECITRRLKAYLTEYEVFTITEMHWNGLKNGKLLALCAENDFDLLLTIDKNMVNQQNIKNTNMSIVIFNSNSSKMEELKLFIPAFKSKIKEFQRRKAYIINK